MHTVPREIIQRVYHNNHKAMDILLAHSEAVAQKALEVARKVPHLKPDLCFIREAALLHDIGMIRTNAPSIGCYGDLPYICHGVEGRAILEAQGHPTHALACERHLGVGLTINDIKTKSFPLPEREMIPLSIEEKIVCLADKFFSKLGDSREKSITEVRTSIASYGEDKTRELESMLSLLCMVS